MFDTSENLFLHADGDSFFVACELVIKPEYRGLPVIVGEDRGIAVAMSQEAKELGITRGMPTFKIKKSFPEVIILSHHFDLYNHISKGVYDILLSYFEKVEKYSIDECFAVVKPSDIAFAGNAEKLLRDIKSEIKEKFNVTFSLGLARTKALAKTASKLEKPSGVVLLLDEQSETEALKRTAIDDIWGIGRKTFPRLKLMGIENAYDFIHYPSDKIQKHFSEPLQLLQKELSGKPYYEVVSDSDPRDQKSIQSTATFKPPSSNELIICAELSLNVEHACARARKLALMTNSITFFIKNTDFHYRFGEARILQFTTDPSVILNAIEPALKNILLPGEKIRSTGVTLCNLRRNEDIPRDLFGIQEKNDSKNGIEKVGDMIREKFGSHAFKHASSLRGNDCQKGNSFPKTYRQ